MLLLSAAIFVEMVSPSTRYSLRARIFGATIWLMDTIIASLLIPPIKWLWLKLGVPPLLHVNFGIVANVLVAIVFADFLCYWRHRFEHRFFWPVHAVHHSATDLHAANSFGHFIEAIPNLFIVLIPISLIDFGGIEVPLAAVMFLGLLQLYIHSPVTIEFGRLRALVVDNRYHRVHHSIEAKHFDKNFGITLSIWDRLFGTAYYPASDEWPATGIADAPPPKSIADYLLFPVLRYRVGSNLIRNRRPARVSHRLDERGSADAVGI